MVLMSQVTKPRHREIESLAKVRNGARHGVKPRTGAQLSTAGWLSERLDLMQPVILPLDLSGDI